MNITDLVPAEMQGPDYNIYYFTDQISKVVRFNSTAPRRYPGDREKFNHYDKKIDASISRTRRMVLEYALCNDWEYFCTFTIAQENYDRENLSKWYSDFSQWLRDQRKKFKKLGFDLTLKYLLVPELHEDGCSWHIHGFFSGVGPLLISFYYLDKNGWNVPYDLVDEGYYCWFDYWMKFGYCSLAPIQDKVACAFYVSKYISKSFNKTGIPLGKDSYYHTQGLNRASLKGSVYGRYEYLDKFLTHHYDFCSTGMTHTDHKLDWTFGLQYMDFELMEAYAVSDLEVSCPEADTFYEYAQLRFNRFGEIYEEETA